MGLPIETLVIATNSNDILARTLAGGRLSLTIGALAGAGFAIPSACAGAGTCGLCRVRVSGAEPPLPTERARLSRLELRAGTRLACQVGLRQHLQGLKPRGARQGQVTNHHIWCMPHHGLHQFVARIHRGTDRNARSHQISGQCGCRHWARKTQQCGGHKHQE